MLNFSIYNHSLFGAGIAVPSFSKANEERSSRFRVASPMTEIAHAMPPKQVTKTYPQSIRANLDNEHPTTLLQKREDANSTQILAAIPAFKSYWDRIGKSWVVKVRRPAKPGSNLQSISTEQLKLVGAWSNTEDITVTTKGVPLITRRFNCTTWDERSRGRWTGDNWGTTFKKVANELFVSATDRALGLNAVPTGSMITLRPDEWARLFAKHVCSTPAIVSGYLNRMGANGSVSVGWLQRRYDNLKSPSSSQPRCTGPLPNKIIVGDDFYNMRISQYVSGRCDQNSNCFLSSAGKYILLDNDCVRYDKHNTSPKLNFCTIPQRLQTHILQRNDFERRLHDFLGLEIPEFQTITPTAAAIERFQFLQSQLRACV